MVVDWISTTPDVVTPANDVAPVAVILLIDDKEPELIVAVPSVKELPVIAPVAFTVVKAPVLALVEPIAPSKFALIVPTEPENTALLLDEPPSLASGI